MPDGGWFIQMLGCGWLIFVVRCAGFGSKETTRTKLKKSNIRIPTRGSTHELRPNLENVANVFTLMFTYVFKAIFNVHPRFKKLVTFSPIMTVQLC